MAAEWFGSCWPDTLPLDIANSAPVCRLCHLTAADLPLTSIAMERVAKGSGALHGFLVLVAFGCCTALAPRWPWHFLMPLLVYAGIVLAVPHLWRTAPRLNLGQFDGAPLACALALSLATSGVLVGFHTLA